MDKKPLYRKVSKTTHNGCAHASYENNPRSSYSRHTKNGMQKSMRTRSNNNGNGLYDYTPLYKFLLKQEGKDWNDVWQECQSRLNTVEPIFKMVVNVNKNGLVNDNVPVLGIEPPSLDWKGRDVAETLKKCFRYGEGTYFSKMYVNENNTLQFVDKNYKTGPNYEIERKWGETYNGELYETYKRTEKKVRKMKSYM